MLEVDYSGGGVFRKYIDYMKKTRTQVIRPSNTEAKRSRTRYRGKGQRPQSTELPMTERDLKILQKNSEGSHQVPGALQLERQLAAHDQADRHPGGQDQGDGGRAPADLDVRVHEELVKKHLGLEASNDLFEINCLSLDHILDKKYKKRFFSRCPLPTGASGTLSGSSTPCPRACPSRPPWPSSPSSRSLRSRR